MKNTNIFPVAHFWQVDGTAGYGVSRMNGAGPQYLGQWPDGRTINPFEMAGGKTEMASYALFYALELKWPVFPVHVVSESGYCSCGAKDCRTPGRHPRIDDWRVEASTDPEKIRRWWGRWPDANIALPTGEASGILTLETDSGTKGFHAMQGLGGDGKALDSPVLCMTGDGVHVLFFRMPTRNIPSGSKLLEGVDLNAEGGFALVPPSLDMTGRNLKWELSSRPWENRLTELPLWLRVRIDELHSSQGTEDPVARTVPPDEQMMREDLPRPDRESQAAGSSRSQEAEQKSRNDREAAGSTWADLPESPTVRWLWQDMIPMGMLTMMGGESGIGKSMVALDLCRRILLGDFMPDGELPSDMVLDGNQKVVWLETEAGQTLNRSRAQRWRLPVDRILSPLTDPYADFNLQDSAHREALHRSLSRKDVVFCVLDSLSGGHNEEENSAKMLRIVKPLAEIARDTGKPILVLHHLGKPKKGMEKMTMHRLRGSSTIVQHARSVLALYEQAGQLVLDVVKANLSEHRERYGLGITQGGVEYGPAPAEIHRQSAESTAVEFLKARLAEDPLYPAKVGEVEAEDLGISKATLHRARRRLGINAKKDGLHGGWVWYYEGGRMNC